MAGTPDGEKPTYQYQPIVPSESLRDHSLRVIVLLPADGRDAPLRCELEHITIGSILEDYGEKAYNAISYTWGDEKFSEKLYTIQSGEEDTYLLISPSVSRILRGLRGQDARVRLWVDAICVNQANLAEKNDQVPRMDSIYRLASQTLVWLGEGDHTISLALSLVLKIVELQLQQPEQSSLGMGMALQQVLRVRSDVFEKLLQLPWFHRRWILQEISLAQECHMLYGETAYSWTVVRKGFELLQQAQGDWLGMQTRLFDNKAETAIRTMLSLNRYSGHILDLLWDFHHAACKEKHDKIYALLGLLKDAAPGDSEVGASVTVDIDSDEALASFAALALEQKTQPEPFAVVVDYQRSWQEIFTEIAAYFVATGSFAAITRHLYAFGSLAEGNPGQPSWVPDWSRERRVEPKGGLSKTVPWVKAVEVEHTIVHLIGHKLGEVEHVWQDFPAEASEFRACIASIAAGGVEENGVEISDTPARKVATGKLIRTGLDTAVLEPINDTTSNITEAYIVNDLAATGISKVLFDGEQNRSHDGLLTGIQRCLKSAAFFSTSESEVGVTGTKIQQGDVIVDIEGYHALPDGAFKQQVGGGTHKSRQAAILRRIKVTSKECGKPDCQCRSTAESYQLIGPCVVVGDNARSSEPGREYSIL
ncbi:hypothetical protein LTR78_001370 [Recurvomyces mirabilis]|uniref:Heterokaryon incompatibility domain-containing protein n=1 Tax=Recurvomyces mirabilis TaxID=574656 RepID=A0AAE1C5M1_9PEZI|nr:hypothetical protein LTR78_001370 [Recurvomyces mirabilis]KAK5161347.1 hypothetical protein LTS14_001143 [Recurvomyces mirabilis]